MVLCMGRRMGINTAMQGTLSRAELAGIRRCMRAVWCCACFSDSWLCIVGVWVWELQQLHEALRAQTEAEVRGALGAGDGSWHVRRAGGAVRRVHAYTVVQVHGAGVNPERDCQ